MTDPPPPPPESSDAWQDLDRLFDDIRARVSRSWSEAFPPTGGTAPGAPAKQYRTAPADVTDTGGSFRIVVEIPGVPKELLDVRVRGTSVEIRGDRSVEPTAAPGAVRVRHERTYAGFYRHVELPSAVVANDAKAKLENGVLELEIPKVPPSPGSGEVKVAVG